MSGDLAHPGGERMRVDAVIHLTAHWKDELLVLELQPVMARVEALLYSMTLNATQ